MAIILITGLPGHGKTLYTIARFKAEAEKKHREIFQCSGEPDATIRKAGTLKPITGIKLAWPTIDPMKWFEAPPGSLVIIDECQFVFPVRGRGEPAEWIGRLATHRHLGIDIVLITQNPMLLDSFVRRLIDQHFHIVRKFGTKFATIHEYPNGVHDQVAKSRGQSITHEWSYPKDVFDLYTSAEVHTVKVRIPARVWLLVAVPFILGGLIWFLWMRLQPEAVAERVNGAPPVSASPAAARPGRSGPPGRPGQPTQQPASPSAYLTSFEPRVPNLDYTAPAYDGITQPVEAPYPAACVSSAKDCRCYSQQATRLSVPDDMCRQIVDRGFFVAWRAGAKSSAEPQQQGRAAPLPPGGVVARGSVPVYGMVNQELRPGPLSSQPISPQGPARQAAGPG